MSKVQYIGDVDPQEALEYLRKKFPAYIFEMHQKGYVIRKAFNGKHSYRACLHGRALFACSYCKEIAKKDPKLHVLSEEENKVPDQKEVPEPAHAVSCQKQVQEAEHQVLVQKQTDLNAQYIGNVDSYEALEYLQKTYPHRNFQMHRLGYVIFQTGKRNHRACLHGSRLYDCRHCKDLAKQDPNIPGCQIQFFHTAYDVLNKEQADPLHGRVHEEAPFIPLEISDEQIQSITFELNSRGVLHENGACFVFNPTLTNSWKKQISFQGKSISLYKMRWILTNKRLVPDGFCMRHISREKCIGGECFAIGHVEIGTARQNHCEDRLRDNTLITEKKKKQQKLAEKLVLSIYSTKGLMSLKQRSLFFGVSKNTIRKIDGGATYSLITGNWTKRIRLRNAEYRKRHARPRSSATKKDYQNVMERIRNSCTQMENGCIHSSYARDQNGYSRIKMIGHQAFVHVVVWEYYFNKCKIKPAHLVVRHQCGNPACCNPDHLKLGTHGENFSDSYIHGTRAKRKRRELTDKEEPQISNTNEDETLAEENGTSKRQCCSSSETIVLSNNLETE